MKQLRTVCDALMFDKMDRKRFERLHGKELMTQWMAFYERLKDDLLPEVRAMVEEVRTMLRPEVFFRQMDIFSHSKFYAQQRNEFSKEQEKIRLQFELEVASLTKCQQELRLFYETLRNHKQYGGAFNSYPGKHEYKAEQVREYLELMMLPTAEGTKRINWITLLTMATLHEEMQGLLREALEERVSQGKPHNVSDETLRKAIQTMCDDKSIKFQYDFAWLMAIMNERKQFPHFTSADEFKEKMVKWEIRRVPSGSILEKYLPDTTVDFPDWRYSDDKGRDRSSRRGKEERLRRQKLVEHFLELVGMKPQ